MVLKDVPPHLGSSNGRNDKMILVQDNFACQFSLKDKREITLWIENGIMFQNDLCSLVFPK